VEFLNLCLRAPLKAVTVLVLARDGTVERGAPDLFKRAGLNPGSFYFHVLINSKTKTARNAVGNPVMCQAALRAAQSITSNIALSQTPLTFLSTENSLTLA
jgi:hypothetical protein